MIEEHQSQAYDIQKSFFDLVTADAFFAGYTARLARTLAVMPAQLPTLGVYFVSEQHTSDGDANAGCIRFSHTVRIGFSVIIADNDPELAHKKLDAACLAIQRILFTNYSLFNPGVHPHNTENVAIESITGGSRRHNSGTLGPKNETPFAELQYEVNAFFRTEWYPDITDLLEQISVTTGFYWWETHMNQKMREQVTVKYFFAQPKEDQANGDDENRHSDAAGQATVNRGTADAGPHGPTQKVDPAGHDQSRAEK